MRLTVVAVLLLGSSVARAQSTAPAALVPFNAPESAARLARSQHKVDFFPLVNQFESQQNLGYCGPASAVIVLNTLRIDNPAIANPRDAALFPEEFRSRLPPGLEPLFHRYTQGTSCDEQTKSVNTRCHVLAGNRTAGPNPH